MWWAHALSRTQVPKAKFDGTKDRSTEDPGRYDEVRTCIMISGLASRGPDVGPRS